MTNRRFLALTEKRIAVVKKLRDTKGKEYANSDTDRLANFKDVAKELGISPQQVLMVYFKKHMRSLDSFLRHHRTFTTESVQSRISDAITYLLLLEALIEDCPNKPRKKRQNDA